MMQHRLDPVPSRGRAVLAWSCVLLGEAVFVFALAALSGPGQIDMVDGLTRYEVARSLVDHGDSIIRDPRIEFGVFPGRDGQRYTTYRFPQSLLGAGAVLVADATGPVREARRHFFFVLTSAAAAAVLALAYTFWFRFRGHSPAAAVGWSLLGIVCTPNWYYATSSFDDLLGTAAVVPAVVLAYLGRRRRPLASATAAGLLLGLAFNAKQPLGLFVLPVLTALYDPERPLRTQLGRFVLIGAGLAAGVVAYLAYDQVKFTPEFAAERAEIQKRYTPTWSDYPLLNLLDLLVSPGAGMIWYWPPLLLALAGLAQERLREKWLCRGVLTASVGFVLFCSLLYFAKGDWAWGPRYLTPVFALLWLFVPAGTVRMTRSRAVLLLSAGFVVQLLALSVMPDRLYLENGLDAAFYGEHPMAYFHPRIAHLLNRPREIVEILSSTAPTEAYTPAPEASLPLPPIVDLYDSEGGDRSDAGPRIVRKYRLLNTLRPWWISQRYLTPAERPVPLEETVAVLLGLLTAGAALMAAGCRAAFPLAA